MGFLIGKKKKNDEQRFSWWLLVVGFVLGILATLVVLQGRPQPVNDYVVNPEGLYLTATHIIEMATATMQATLSQSTNNVQAVDGPFATASAIIVEVTQQAAQKTAQASQ